MYQPSCLFYLQAPWFKDSGVQTCTDQPSSVCLPSSSTAITKMNLEESLSEALAQLWRAAVSVSALKHIAGLVTAEWSGVCVNTGQLYLINFLQVYINSTNFHPF